MSQLPATGYLSNASRTEGEMKTALEDVLAAAKQAPGGPSGTAVSTLTIAAGSVTPGGGAAGGVYLLDTEAAAATDDLANILQTNLPEPSLLLVGLANAARVVVVKHSAGGAGQITLRTAGDFVLGDTTHWLLLQRTGTTWQEIWRMPEVPVHAVLTKTANYTTTVADRNKLIDGTANTWTLTLLAAATAGKGFLQPVKNSGTGLLTIDANGAETIDGLTTLALLPGDEILLLCDGSNWKSFGRYEATKNGGVVLIGGKITVTMAANAATLAIKTDAGNDPSAAEPVWCWFRHATLTDGSSVLRKITAATSTVISSGSKGGTVDGIPSRVYADVIDNAGTVELAWHQPVDVSGSPAQLSLKGFNESALVSTTAEGGVGAADSAGVMYSTTARANVAFRIAAYFESTQATAGTWASAAAVVQQMGPGVRRTGDLVQRQYVQTGAVATGTTTVPDDNTIPQNTEGDQYLSLAITPTSALNLLEIHHRGNYHYSVGGAYMATSLYQDTTADALASSYYLLSPDDAQVVTVGHRMRAGTVSATTMKTRTGGSGAGTTTVNGRGGSARYGGVLSSCLSIDEVWA